MKKHRLNPEDLAAKYVALLEGDLKLERERIRTARADVEFYRGKCERLELSLLESSPTPQASSFVRRTDPKRPSIQQTKLEVAMKPTFQDLRRKWEALTEEEQNKVMKSGEWKPEETKVEGG